MNCTVNVCSLKYLDEKTKGSFIYICMYILHIVQITHKDKGGDTEIRVERKKKEIERETAREGVKRV